MNTVILIIHSIFAVALIGLILLQSGKGGLGNSFGGTDVYRSKRGAERIVFSATIVFAVLFLISSIASLLVR